MDVFAALTPEPVWRHFAALTAIPRPSRGEDAVRRHIAAWAKAHGIAAEQDKTGNLLLRKPATRGHENRPGVILQAHLDMVCQSLPDACHDFTKDPIRPEIANGWMLARTTTLGADNGIGVALALAALEESGLDHPDLEVLLTVDEEDGMGGALGLAPGWLKGRSLLNLDTEAWGEFYVGCAGSCNVDATAICPTEPAPDASRAWRLTVSGLAGGHSGCDIHLGRGNANKILIAVLSALAERAPLRLSALAGGSARNAIPRDAFADILLPIGTDWLDDFLDEQNRRLAAELENPGDRLKLALVPATPGPVLTGTAQTALLDALTEIPNGVRRMSDAFDGVVETSDNLGMMRLEDGAFSANVMVRSLVDDQAAILAETIAARFRQAGLDAALSNFHPGWAPDPASALLARCRAVYAETFGMEAGVQVIHAGLECGVIGAAYPGLDMLSFGPTIQGPHAPGERVEIASVAQAWTLLKAILRAL